MEIDEINGFRHIHFVGIGGISMSALSKLCLHNAIKVSGSDRANSAILNELKNLGIKIYIGHKAQNINEADLVVYTAAVPQDNVELVSAKKSGIKIMERADFLQLIANSYKTVLAVSGTHGKTTTCAMLGSIFIEAGLNPTVHDGGESEVIGGNLHIGGKEFFITETCEFQKHLLKMPHNVGVILNIEMDHPDTYKTEKDLFDTFSKFGEDSKDLLVINEKFKSICKCKNIITFGKYGIFTAKNIKEYKRGAITFDCYKAGEFYAKFELSVFGVHNISNALACIAVADYFNIRIIKIKRGLKNFTGVKRRFEYMGKINNSIVIHDYAHHPTEILNTIETAHKLFKKNIICVFQPHTYSRTIKLFNDFISCFSSANEVIVLPTYSAREEKDIKGTGKTLQKAMNFVNKNAIYKTNFKSCYNYLLTKENSVILIIGAGDIVKLAQKIKTEYIKNIS